MSWTHAKDSLSVDIYIFINDNLKTPLEKWYLWKVVENILYFYTRKRAERENSNWEFRAFTHQLHNLSWKKYKIIYHNFNSTMKCISIYLHFLVAKQGRETEAAVFSELHSKLQSLVNKFYFCFHLKSVDLFIVHFFYVCKRHKCFWKIIKRHLIGNEI